MQIHFEFKDGKISAMAVIEEQPEAKEEKEPESKVDSGSTSIKTGFQSTVDD